MAKRRPATRHGSVAATSTPNLPSLLTPQFTAKHIGPALLHYSNAVNGYSKAAARP
jgi:hypothetical protein